MITRDQVHELVTSMRSHTISAFRENQRSKIPYIMDDYDMFPDGDMVLRRERCKISPVHKYHYNDRWYMYKDSVDRSDETFGILKVDNLPYMSFKHKWEKKSFVASMERMVTQNYVVPFMLFADGKFVNWYNIDIVYDRGVTYLLLHGNQYNQYILDNIERYLIVTLPFKVEYIGTLSDELFNLNYRALQEYMQESLNTDENGRILISVPNMNASYQYNDSVFSVGMFLYQQVRLNFLGLVKPERVAKLKNIELIRYTYDSSGNVVDQYPTRFNLLDKDSYDRATYAELCHTPLEQYVDQELFSFNDDGLFDDVDGRNKIYVLTDKIYFDKQKFNLSRIYPNQKIYTNHSDIDLPLQRENYIVFKDGLIDVDCVIDSTILNYISIETRKKNNILITMYHKDSDYVYATWANRFYKPYLSTVANNFIRDINRSATQYIHNMQYLNYSFKDDLDYITNMNNGSDSLKHYDVSVYNQLVHSCVECTTLSGAEANRNLNFKVGIEDRRGLKIPRQHYYNHETYVIVFLNGELIEQYSQMVAYHNFFFLPIAEDYAFRDGDEIEFMYFKNCNNLEIRFQMSEYVLNAKMSRASLDNMYAIFGDSEEIYGGDVENYISQNGFITPSRYKYVSLSGLLLEDKETIAGSEDEVANSIQPTVFSEYIPLSDLKIFERYPENIIKYPELVKPDDNVAFNVSFKEDGIVYIFPEVLANINDVFIAVSSRKFIYERLYTDQKAYRFKLGRRFRYCDNQKQYMVFINGRRLNDESFFITTPKFSRPFWANYLYLTKYADPEDRIEVFYVPIEMNNINSDNTVSLGKDGYIKYPNRNQMEIPFDNQLYAFFINGKKINSNHVIVVDTTTIRLDKDTTTLMPLVINRLNEDTVYEIENHMKYDENNICIYESLIENSILAKSNLGKNEIDKLFNIFVKMSNTEIDMIKQNVGRIAIINEIVRDFWVSSGYPYNEKPFVYDYYLDEIIYKDGDNYILPAMDARADQDINIKKNELHLLYFYDFPHSGYYEKGCRITTIHFVWEYSQMFETSQVLPTILHQDINGLEISNSITNYTMAGLNISDTYEFIFSAKTRSQLLQESCTIKFIDPIYYGMVDKEYVERYKLFPLISPDDLIVVAPYEGMPVESEFYDDMNNPHSYDDLEKDHMIFRDISYIRNYPEIQRIFLDDLIAVVPEDTSVLMSKAIDQAAEYGMDYIKDTYYWLPLDDVLIGGPEVGMHDLIYYLDWIDAAVNGGPDNTNGRVESHTSMSSLKSDYTYFDPEYMYGSTDSSSVMPDTYMVSDEFGVVYNNDTEKINGTPENSSDNITTLKTKYRLIGYNNELLDLTDETTSYIESLDDDLFAYSYGDDTLSTLNETFTTDILRDLMAILLNSGDTTAKAITSDGVIYSDDPDGWQTDPYVSLSDQKLYFVIDTETNDTSVISLSEDRAREVINESKRELSIIISHVDKYLQETPDISGNFTIGNDRYFVYAIPKYYIKNSGYNKRITFNITKDKIERSENIIYTDGRVDSNNKPIMMDRITMEYIGETDYTNTYGHTETYAVWKTNGYFTNVDPSYMLNIIAKAV